MIKLAGKTFDFYDDPDFMDSGKTSPLFENGTLIPKEDLSTVKDGEFGIIIKTGSGEHRKYPCYNASSTILSLEYFKKTAEYLPVEMAKTAAKNIQFYCNKYGIDFDVDMEKFAEPTSLISMTPTQAYDCLALSFIRQRDAIDPDERVLRANELHKMAEAVGREEDDRIWDYVPKKEIWRTAELENGLAQRERFVKEAAAKDPTLPAKFASIVKKALESTPVVAGGLLYEFDKHAGTPSNIKDGFYTFLAGHIKVAKDIFDAKTPEEIKKIRALENLAINTDLLRGKLSQKFIEKFRHYPVDVYENSDLAVKQVLDSIIKSVDNFSNEHVLLNYAP